MKQRWYNLEIEQLEDGAIRLTQAAENTTTPQVINLHLEQVRLIARQALGMQTDTGQKLADAERRLSVLTARLNNIVCDDFMRRELIERCGDGPLYLERWDGLLDLAIEFDGGRLVANEC